MRLLQHSLVLFTLVAVIWGPGTSRAEEEDDVQADEERGGGGGGGGGGRREGGRRQGVRSRSKTYRTSSSSTRVIRPGEEGGDASSVVYGSGSSYVPSTERRNRGRGRGRGRHRGRNRQSSSSSSSSSSTSSLTGPDGAVRETVTRTSYGTPGSGVRNGSYSYTNTYPGSSSSSSSSSTSSGPSHVDQPYFNQGETEEDRQGFFRWNGGSGGGSGGGSTSSVSRRIKTTKTTTTQTRPGSTTRFTYTLPGVSGGTSYRNSTYTSSSGRGSTGGGYAGGGSDGSQTTYTSSSSSGRGGTGGYSGGSRDGSQTTYTSSSSSGRGGGGGYAGGGSGGSQTTYTSSSSSGRGGTGGYSGGSSDGSQTTYTSSSSSGRGGTGGYSGGSSSGSQTIDRTDRRYQTTRQQYGGRGQGQGQDRNAAGFGETYRKSTEEEAVETQEYEDEGYNEEFARGPYISEQDRLHPLAQRGFGGAPGYGRDTHPCDQSSCYPATGNLLIGREGSLTTTSTCGINKRERYCIVSHLKDRKKCFWCDSRPQWDGNPRYSHKISNIVYRFDPRTRQRSWWQSENGQETASIQLDLEAEFHFTHLILTFRTFRPAAMLIERSFDFGKTWKVYRNFAYDCSDSFPGVKRGVPTSINDVVCESRYSAVEPSTEGEVIFRVLPPNIEITNPYSDEVQNLLKITNLRVNFTKLHTLGDQLLDSRLGIKEKYYYALYDMVVRGSCSCYGHASRCLPLPGVVDKPGMVHGRCECTHNTKGLNCEHCEDFYNDLPWRPAVGKESNACKKCNCNNHATMCHFDSSVYEATGYVSGGVCDDCSGNTQGRNCEECVPYYYLDPARELYDPEICQPCNCDSRGSVDSAICDSRSDPVGGLLAGRCHCKRQVDGLKCDRCKAGYWNFSSENPEGCEACTCNTLGTVNNEGCDVVSGECSCKRFVTGRDCNQCLPQHYGLSELPDGCQPCACDPGGALDNNCDVLTGQCKCRPHVSGRRCEAPEEGYYVAALDYLTYEAELAKGSENCQVVMRALDGREATWTGLGFMRTFDGSYLEFDIENIETSMDYDFVIRYEPQFRGEWENVRVTIERPGPLDPNGPCANTRPTDDQMVINLPDSRRHVKLFPPVCLEAGKRYKVRIDFRRTNSHTDSPSASVLIDSIVLIPRVESINFYSGSLMNENRRQEYERYRCSETFYDGQNLATVPEVCKEDHLDSIGFLVYGQAYSCQCDGTGSRSSICSSLGGQCDCKLNVVGRRCDHCAPGTYGFGPEGCKVCGCSPVGALDNFCDQQTGQCKCRPNTYGRQCNECQPGFWNFPNCQRCECHGHADTCDSYTGTCHECRDNTTSANCAVCVEGFYGDPRLEVGIACRPCPCPGTDDSGHSFAARCSLDPRTKDVVCECEQGYAGSRCDVCADNYYGDPEVPGGQCQPCSCSNNIDISRPGNCDPKSGECQQCLYNTFGLNCQRCQPGYYGDALNQECRDCVCNLLGSNQTIGACDHETGQCPCLPSVLGLECDRCAPSHWKIASGQGCEACACDPIGSYSNQCNEFDGQCQCRGGFGGRQCNQCETNYFGDPRVECLPCNCNRDGSETLQCNHETGHCQCREGIGGEKCDACARGYTGQAPYCQPCGECFDNWDIILTELKERTQALIAAAGEIKQTGATGAYSHEFESMEEKINDVRDILLSANMTAQSLANLEALIAELSESLTVASVDLEGLELGIDNTTQRISLATNALADLRLQAEELRDDAGDLKAKATRLQEGNVEGALNLTRHAGERSWAAQNRVGLTEVIISESERNRRRTENLLLHVGDRFNRTQVENEAKLGELSSLLDGVEDGMPDLNEHVCDHRGDPCDSLCGGAGCGKCGGLSCNAGLINTVGLALRFAEDAETELKKKEASADELLRGVSGAKRQSDVAYDLAKMAFDLTFQGLNLSVTYKFEINKLLEEIEEYFSTPGSSPNEIKLLAEQVLALDISLRPEQITDLAERITLTIDSLTNIDAIIDATRNDLDLAQRLKERADQAKRRAEGTLGVAERVVEALDEAAGAQSGAETAIMNASDDIEATQIHLTQITSETNVAQEKATVSMTEVQELERRVEQVKSEYQLNQRHLEDTNIAVDQADLKAKKAANDARQLEDKYQMVVTLLNEKSNEAEDARRRAEELKKSANKLAFEAQLKLSSLTDIERSFETNEGLLLDYEEIIRRMEDNMMEYNEYILQKTEFYAVCQSGRR